MYYNEGDEPRRGEYSTFKLIFISDIILGTFVINLLIHTHTRTKVDFSKTCVQYSLIKYRLGISTTPSRHLQNRVKGFHIYNDFR